MKSIPLTNSDKFTIVDDGDYEWLMQWKWQLTRGGYVYRCGWDLHKHRSISVYMHRAIADTPQQLDTDHINCNKLDNRRSNLRSVTHAINLRNTGSLRKNNTSGYTGVCWSKGNRKWLASVSISGRNHYIGYFDSAEEAAAAYALKVDELTGEVCVRVENRRATR